MLSVSVYNLQMEVSACMKGLYNASEVLFFKNIGPLNCLDVLFFGHVSEFVVA